MEAKTQIAYFILMFLFIFISGDSVASPPMCNLFIGCFANIKVCKFRCYFNYRGAETCVSHGPIAPPPTLLPPKLDNKCCRCWCIFQKRPNKSCPVSKPTATI
ncbi:hypothetical protein DH2020_015410 [Rehmannia glutinosa]|uniref:Uncharacterized protein n=1 Tax=Rehmannia glutinosa TaxID=99300 RepID=A0ABR0WSI6_REHGL